MESASTPVKPWEINRITSNTSNNNFSALRSSNMDNSLLLNSEINSAAPPVPPRPPDRNYGVTNSSFYSPYNSYGSYGGGYGSGYGSMYGMGGGLYGGGMGGGMYGNNMYNRGMNTFSQRAEESTRNAFQSVESIVRAFSAISAMFESTFGAVYSSFRAVLDVADHFSRVKATFSDILSSLAVIRLVKFLYRRAMRILRLGSCDDAWGDVANTAQQTMSAHAKSHPGSWPILLFFSVILGGPYLIWRLLRGDSNEKSRDEWANGDADHVVAVTQHNFVSDHEDELSFNSGEQINLAPKELQPNIQNWLLASKDGKAIGMVPANYVKILGKRRGKLKSDMPPPTLKATPVVTLPPNTNLHAEAFDKAATTSTNLQPMETSTTSTTISS